MHVRGAACAAAGCRASGPAGAPGRGGRSLMAQTGAGAGAGQGSTERRPGRRGKIEACVRACVQGQGQARLDTRDCTLCGRRGVVRFRPMAR